MHDQTGTEIMGRKPERKALNGRWQELLKVEEKKTQQVLLAYPAQLQVSTHLTEGRPP